VPPIENGFVLSLVIRTAQREVVLGPNEECRPVAAGCGERLVEGRKRRACLIENDPRYADVICRRWQQYSGEPAIREADGRPFAEVQPATPSSGGRP
jgi:hypothetical protein